MWIQYFLLLPDNACAKKEPEPQVEKAADERSEPSSSSDKSSKSGVGNDFSSDEAKESEGDSDPVGDNKQEDHDRDRDQVATSKEGSEVIVENNNNNNKPVIVKFSCDICNISVNSATQLSQVSFNILNFFHLHIEFQVQCIWFPFRRSQVLIAFIFWEFF